MIINIYFYISSILFLTGISYSSKQICKNLKIFKQLNFIVDFSNNFNFMFNKLFF